MPSLSDIVADEAIVILPFGADKVTVGYHPGVLTTKNIKLIQSNDSDPNTVIDFTCKLIASWDLTDGGAPIPITPDGVDGIPIMILKRIVTACMADAGEQVGEAPSDSVAS